MALVLKAGSPLLILREELREARPAEVASPLLVSQSFYRADDPFIYVGGERRDRAPAERRFNAFSAVAEQRMSALEQRLASISDTLEQVMHENEVLRARVNDLLQRQMNQDGWLVSSGSASELSLH